MSERRGCSGCLSDFLLVFIILVALSWILSHHAGGEFSPPQNSELKAEQKVDSKRP